MSMSFMHSIAVLMAGSGLKNVLTAFGSVDKILSEKNDPQNFRAIRLLVQEVLRSVIMTKLDKRASCRRTVKVWRDSLAKQVIIMMAFSREATGLLVELFRKKSFTFFYNYKTWQVCKQMYPF